jgi:hypothetical protein
VPYPYLTRATPSPEEIAEAARMAREELHPRIPDWQLEVLSNGGEEARRLVLIEIDEVLWLNQRVEALRENVKPETLWFLTFEEQQVLKSLPLGVTRKKRAALAAVLQKIEEHDQRVAATTSVDDDTLKQLGERFTIHTTHKRREKPKQERAEMPHERAKRLVRERTASGQKISLGDPVVIPPRPPKAAPENEKQKGRKNGKQKSARAGAK